jgi:hypothetical protein
MTTAFEYGCRNDLTERGLVRLGRVLSAIHNRGSADEWLTEFEKGQLTRPKMDRDIWDRTFYAECAKKGWDRQEMTHPQIKQLCDEAWVDEVDPTTFVERHIKHKEEV